MLKKRSIYTLVAIFTLFVLLLTACGGAQTQAPAAEEPTAAPEVSEPKEVLSVGIVLPTKDEPRWIQDETALQGSPQRGWLRCRNPVQPG